MTPEPLASLFAKCDEEIRNGRAHVAAGILRGLNLSDLARKDRLQFAFMCRRIGLIQLGLRSLAPLVHSKRRVLEPTPEELGEYATLLMKNGSVHEAMSTLRQLPAETKPEVSLHRGLCLMMCWEHADAIPHLSRYIDSRPDPYALLVAQLNLALSLIACERYLEVLPLLERLIQGARSQAHLRILSNALTLRAQVHLNCGRFESCQEDLEEARRLLAGETSSDQLFVLKWKAILESMKSRTVDAITAFRAEAENRQHWEHIRDSDFYALQIQFDAKLYAHLVFGSPYKSFRERLRSRFGSRADLPEFYTLGNPEGPVLDLTTGDILKDGERTPSTLTNKLRVMLFALVRDFYKPASLGSIFAELYPNEKFNAFTSPNRVHQVLSRARRWIEAQGLTPQIDSRNGFRLTISGPFSLLVPLSAVDDPMLAKWHQFTARMSGNTEFTSHDVAGAIHESRRQGNRLVDWALASGRVIQIGAGRKTRYRIRSAA